MDEKEKIELAIKESKSIGLIVFHGEIVEKVHNKGGSSSRILIITGSSVSFWKIETKPVSSRVFYWNDLTIFLFEEEMFKLQFGSGLMMFHSEKPHHIKRVFSRVFQRIFSEKEQESLGVTGLSRLKLYPNGAGFISRFMSYSYHQKVVINEDIIKFIKEIGMHHMPNVIIPDKATLLEAILPLMQSLSIASYIKSIEMNISSNIDSFSLLSDLFKYDNSLQHLLINKKASKSFSSFIDTFKSSSNSIIKGLSFCNSEFNKKHVPMLLDIVTQKKLTSICFQNCFLPEILPFIYSNLLVEDFFKSIVMLNLDNTKNINVETLLSSCQQLSSLSLCKCDLEIANVIELYSQSQMKKLRYLNLSNNHCAKSIGSITFNIDLALFRLDVNNVEWGIGCIYSFFVAILAQKWKTGLSLSCSKIKGSDEDLGRTITALSKSRGSPLYCLSWNHNMINDDFLTFISKSKHIKCLYFSKCFVGNQESLLKKFAEVINAHPTLEKVIMKGSLSKYIGPNIKSFLDSLENETKLNYLDISENMIGKEGLSSLSQFIKRCSVQYISFKGSGISELPSLMNFLDEIKGLNRSLYIDWPDMDLIGLSASSPIDDSTLKVLKEKLSSLYSEPKSPEINETSSRVFLDPFLERFEAYKMDSSNHFPLYIVDSVLSDFLYDREVNQSSFHLSSKNVDTVANTHIIQNQESVPKPKFVISSSIDSLPKNSTPTKLPTEKKVDIPSIPAAQIGKRPVGINKPLGSPSGLIPQFIPGMMPQYIPYQMMPQSPPELVTKVEIAPELTKPDWSFPLEKIAPKNVTSIYDQLNSDYSVRKLSKRVFGE